jgi:hypothetical protein
MALIIKTGELPNGRVSMHSCDNRRCINPDHLSWGTHRDNQLDRAAKGRCGDCRNKVIRVGEDHSMAKLTAYEVSRIRKEYTTGVTRKHLATKFGMSKSQMQRILTGDGWSHLPE